MELLPLSDGRVLIGGFFHRFGTANRVGIARLLPDGGLDQDFDAGSAIGDSTAVSGLAVDGDDGYLVATRSGGKPAGFFRLQANGAMSPQPLSDEEKQRVELIVLADGRRVSGEGSTLTFFSPSGALQEIWTNTPAYTPIRSRHHAAVQSDGGLLVSGIGNDLPDGKANFGLVRLLTDGRVDPEFGMAGGVSLPNSGIHQVSFDSNGGLVVRGEFTLVNGMRKRALVRLSSDGILDSTFDVDDFYPEERFALTPEGQVLVSGTVWPEDTQQGIHNVWRLRPDGLLDETFGSGNSASRFFCETIFNVVYHPRAGIWLQTRPGGSCWVFVPYQELLHLVGASDRDIKFSLVPQFITDVFQGSGRIQHILPHPVNDLTYVIGEFTHLDGIPRAGVVRVRSDGTMDSEFEFQHPELFGHYGVIGAHVENDGRLTLLTSDVDADSLLSIQGDGSLTSVTRVSVRLPSATATRLSDGSWFVMRPLSTSLNLLRIGADGRLLARRAVPFADSGKKIAVTLDGGERGVIGGPLLPTSTGPWSGLLRLDRDALAPLTLSISSSPASSILTVAGPPGRRVTVQSSTDLRTWSDWLEASLDAPKLAIEIPPTFPQGQIFYRAVFAEDLVAN